MATDRIRLNPNMVFPTTKLNPINKLITEGNLTQLINNILDTDTYIVPPSTIDGEIVWNLSAGTSLVPITTINYEALEIMLHGYYFNLNISEILNALTNDNSKFVVSIIIDKTVDNYPELYGEIAEQQTINIEAGNEIHPLVYTADGIQIAPEAGVNPTKLDDAFKKLVITGVSAEDSSNPPTTYQFSLTPDWELRLDTTAVTAPTFEDGYSIEYVSLYNMLQCQVLDIDDNDSVGDFELSTLPEKMDIYSLDIMYRVNGQYYLPMNNFPKFISSSIANIDGGEI